MDPDPTAGGGGYRSAAAGFVGVGEDGGGWLGSTGALALVACGEGGVDGEGWRVEARRMAASAAVHGDGME